MKLILTTRIGQKRSTDKNYLVKLPNYFDTEKVPDLIKDIKVNYLYAERIVKHELLGDTALTLKERKQLDTLGKITVPPILINCPELINGQKS